MNTMIDEFDFEETEWKSLSEMSEDEFDDWLKFLHSLPPYQRPEQIRERNKLWLASKLT